MLGQLQLEQWDLFNDEHSQASLVEYRLVGNNARYLEMSLQHCHP